MPKIPQYDQGQLASQLVGTPGVDTSGSSMLQGVSQSIGNIGETVLRYKAQLDALAKVQKQQYDAMDIAQHQYNIDSNLDDMQRQLKDKYAGDPDAGVAEFKRQGLEAIKTYSDGIGDPAVKSGVFTGSLNRFREQVGGMENEWAGSARIKSAQGKWASVADHLAMDVGRTTQDSAGNVSAMTPEDAYKKINNLGQTAEPFRFVLGTGLGADVRKKQETAAINYLRTLARTNPDALDPVLKSGKFEQFIDGSSLDSIYADVKQRAREVKTLQLEEEKADRARATLDVGQQLEILRREGAPPSAFDDLATKSSSHLTPTQVNAIRGAGTAQQFKTDRQLSQQQKDAQRKAEKAAKDAAINQVNTVKSQYRSIIESLKTATVDNKTASGVNLMNRLEKVSGQLVAAQAAYLKANGHTNGDLAALQGDLQAKLAGVKSAPAFRRQMRELDSYRKQMAPPAFSNNPAINRRATNFYYQSLNTTYANAKQKGGDPTTTENQRRVRDTLVRQITEMIRAGKL